MDPLSIATGAVALMGVCASIAHAIKKFIENVKTSKPELIKLLDKVEHVRLYLGQLRSIAARLTDPSHRSILVPFDKDACNITMNKLKDLVNKIGGAGDAGAIKRAISWIHNKSVAENLVKDLEEHQANISQALLALAAHSSIVTEEKVVEIVAGINDLTIVQNPFQEAKAGSESQSGPTDKTADMQMWPAQVTRDELPPEYLEGRDSLANASYLGRWKDVFHLIEVGRIQHSESWMNASRMKDSDMLSTMSLWTPLHQAAFLGAPVQVVSQMVDKGAFRTLRTAWTSDDDPLSYHDMTAVEIAREMGYFDLLDTLAPVIRHSLPHATLHGLQQQLHRLLRRLIEDETFVLRLRLPELSVLTELETPIMWFPVYKSDVRIWTFQYFLDGRELLVLAAHHEEAAEEQYFRVSEHEAIAIEEPLASDAVAF